MSQGRRSSIRWRAASTSLSQLNQEWQSPAGAVTMSAPNVQYTYTLLANGVNNSRLISTTYPNGRVLGVLYNSGLDDAVSRVSALTDGAGIGAPQLEAYTYLGANQIAQRTQTEPGIIATIIQQSGDAIGDGGDLYVGLDRFGRLIDSRWISTGTSPGQPTSRNQYGYDRAGQKLYANNLVNPAFSVLYHANGASEASAYDAFGRMTATARGVLSASGSNGTTLDTVATPTDPTHGANPVYGTQEWDLDHLGNWDTVTSDGTTDTRTHNDQNELTADSAGALGYDNNGNLLTQAGQSANTFDAWNRATSIRGTSYVYDALGRRIWESANGGRAFFYDGQRMIETRLGAANSLATNAHEQYVYGQGYIDDVVLRDADVNGGGNLGISGSGLDQRLYYQQDREFNVVALVSQSGSVVERYAYDPYGSVSALDANWNLLNSGSAYGNQVGFTGRWLDETGMWYFRARYLEPTLGRFVSRDPCGHSINGPTAGDGYQDGMSLYHAYFVPGDMDPTGLYEIDVHYYLTYWLAKHIPCFSDAEAMKLANADQGVDENPATSPGFGWTGEQQQVNTEYHNLGPQILMGVPGGSYLTLQWYAATFEPIFNQASPRFEPMGSIRHCDLDKLGIYLHHLQDTYAHAGFDNPVIG